jgi:hypothetical protein
MVCKVFAIIKVGISGYEFRETQGEADCKEHERIPCADD